MTQDTQSAADQRLAKHRIRARAGAAVRLGKVKRLPCEVCGAEPAEHHHIDYADPSRVMWLCKRHHEQTHSQFGKPAPDWMADIRAAQAKIWAQRLASRADDTSSPSRSRRSRHLRSKSRQRPSK